MKKYYEYVDENVKQTEWIGFLDALSEKDKIEFKKLSDDFKRFYGFDDLDNNIRIREFINLHIKGKKVRIKDYDDFQYYEFDDFHISSSYPYISFSFIGGRTRIKTIDFCNNPNEFIKVKVKERKFTPEDPYGEEDWDD